MRVALTGVSGFIGSVLARHLREAGHSVTGLVRAASRREHVEPFVDAFVVGDQADEHAWAALLDGAECLVHNAFDWALLRKGDLAGHLRGNLEGAIRLLHAAAPRQVVFMSTIAVHHDMRPRWAGLVDEDHPLRPGGLYGARKASIEDHLWAARAEEGRRVCALRPCAVYGIDPMLERSIGHGIIRAIRSERRYARAGGGKFVHVDDAAAAATAAVGNPAADGLVCNLADCYARWADLAAMIAEILGIDAEIDLSSPDRPKNTFTKDAARSLGVPLDRGHAGLRAHLAELVERMG